MGMKLSWARAILTIIKHMLPGKCLLISAHLLPVLYLYQFCDLKWGFILIVCKGFYVVCLEKKQAKGLKQFLLTLLTRVSPPDLNKHCKNFALWLICIVRGMLQLFHIIASILSLFVFLFFVSVLAVPQSEMMYFL